MDYLKGWMSNMAKNTRGKKKKENSTIAIYIQIILFIALAILLIMNVFLDMLPVIEIVSGLLLCLMAYNNFYHFKKYKTGMIIYALIGIISIVVGIMELL